MSIADFSHPASLTLSNLTGSSGPDQLSRHGGYDQLWTDIDAADCDDQLACTEYVQDIVQNLLAAEVGTTYRVRDSDDFALA